MSQSEVIERYETIGRSRVLSEAESVELERAVRRECGRVYKLWLPKDDRLLVKLLRRHCRFDVIAAKLKVSENAVRVRLTKLRKKGKAPYVSPAGSTGRYPRNKTESA